MTTIEIIQDKTSTRRCPPMRTASSVFVYWLFVSLIPIYNKFFFHKDKYPYPIATAGIQLGVVALLLGTWNIFQRGAIAIVTTGSNNTNDDARSKSWVLGPHLWWKTKWCAPIGVLFGLKYGVTNLGLHLVPAPTHLLLQATDLVWTVLSAYAINRERLNAVEILCLVGCVAGSVVLGWNQLHSSDDNNEKSSIHAGIFAMFINLLSPVLLGLCIATLRLACCELMRPGNRVGGTVSAVELTTIKLAISSGVALLLASVLESGDAVDAMTGEIIERYYYSIHHRESWWTAFASLPDGVKTGVVGGALLIAVFQVNCTYLTYLTSAVSVGLVGQVKIIPQWIAAAVFAKITSDFVVQGPNLVGAFLIMSSAAAFAGSKFYTAKKQQQQRDNTRAWNHFNIGDDDDSGTRSNSDNDDSGPLLSSDDEEQLSTEKTGLLLESCCDERIPSCEGDERSATVMIVRANYDSLQQAPTTDSTKEVPV